MLAGSSTASTTISTDTSPALPLSPQRSSRLRGLSYLRNYTHNHLSPILSPQPSADSTQSRPLPARTRSSPASSSDRDPSQSQSTPGPEHTSGLSPHPSSVEPGESSAASRAPMTRAISQNASNKTRTVSSATQTNFDPAAQQSSSTAGENLQDNEADAGQRLMATAAQTSLPCIQFIPATEPHRSRPSLDFRRITRTLPSQNSIIRVGRYSERDSATDSAPNTPSDAPIGFKSKVVSRRHCEFSFANNQWYIRDVKSSSGTFLNHIRLSQPGLESRLYPVNDGDIVQLGIDFKGGEEMIFRCVKIRIETNRGWQRGLNKFNKSTYRHLRSLAKAEKNADNDTASKHSTECTICLNSIAPCQALFVAPCSHTWHYKCIRTILEDPRYPQFLCPNCRAQADLDADIEDEMLEDFDSYDEEPIEEDNGEVSGIRSEDIGSSNAHAADSSVPEGVHGETDPLTDAYPSLDDTMISSRNDAISSPHLNMDRLLNRPRGSNLNPSASAFVPSPTSPVAIPASSTPVRHIRNSTIDSVSDVGAADAADLQTLDSRVMQNLGTPSQSAAALEAFGREGPMTPRNNAGPFVLDGSAISADEGPTSDSRIPASP